VVRTPLLSAVQALPVATESPSADAVPAHPVEGVGGGVGAGAAHRPAKPTQAAAQGGPRIVVGAGLAGLTAAYQWLR